MIKIKNISKEFNKIIDKKQVKFYADKNISFDVQDGEILGLLGPNGAGKTTLLRIIAGIMKPTKGEVLFDDKKISENELEVKKKLSFLSGNTKLYKDISCVELLKMCGAYYGMSKKDIDTRILNCFKEIDKSISIDEIKDKVNSYMR